MRSTINMVWHIFKKDVRLLWPFILGAAGIQFMSAGLRYTIEHYNSRLEGGIANLCNLATLPVIALLIAAAVQQDAVPGVRQDWLVRPIRRRDLLLAKLLFVVAMVQGPVLLADTMQGLANGFPISQSLGAAASRGLYLLLGLSLPVLAFASLTRNLAEAVIGAVVAFVVFAAIQILINNRGMAGSVRGTGLLWVAESIMFLTALLGSSAVLALQYSRRKTMLARWAMAVVAFLFLLGYMVPWNFAFAVEQRMSPHPGAGSPILMNFNPGLGRFRLPEGVSHHAVTGWQGGVNGVRDEASTVYVPMKAAGLPERIVLNTDKAEALLTDADGKVIYRGTADDLLIRNDGHGEPNHFTIGIRRSAFFREIGPEDMSPLKEAAGGEGEAQVYQGIALPRNLYDHIKDRPLRLEIDYSLTLLRGTTYTIPALGGDVKMQGVGRCKTRMDDDGDEIMLRCLQAGASSGNCAVAFLEHTPSGRRNPARFSCWPNYSPYFGQYLPDAMTTGRAAFPFRDLTRLAKYPVDASQLAESRVVIRVYQARDHFTRRLVIPEIRLSDWESVEKSTQQSALSIQSK